MRAAEMVRRPGLSRAEKDADACTSFAAVEWHYSDRLIRQMVVHPLYRGESPSIAASQGLRFPARGVLKDTFGAGVMDELAAAHKTFPHRHLAPGAESIGNIGLSCRGVLRLSSLFCHRRHSR